MAIRLKWNRPPDLSGATPIQKGAFWIASAAGTGLFPASGTFGAGLAFVLHVLFFPNLFTPEYWIGGLAALIAVTAVAVWSAEITERLTGLKDDSRVTIDEVAGYFTAVMFLPPGLYYTVPAFILCRIFDIVKLPPANQLQSVRGGVGIVIDDIIASIYACALMHALIYFGVL